MTLNKAQIEWVSRPWAAMQRWSSEATYINYLSSDNQVAVKASYLQSYDRLAALKRKYDPTNLKYLPKPAMACGAVS